MATNFFPQLDPELQRFLARDALHGLNRILALLPRGTELLACDVLGLTMLVEAAGPPAPPCANDDD